MDWYDLAMKELDEWFESGPHTTERMKEYRQRQRDLNEEYEESL